MDLDVPNDFYLLKRALLNERVAPEILDYKGTLLDRVTLGIQAQANAEEDDAMHPNSNLELVRHVLCSERDRVRWLLKAYLRTRLDKIERYAGHLLDSSGLGERLSPQERAYSSRFFVAMGRLLKSSVLDDLPGQYQSLVKRYDSEEHEKLLDTPNLSKYVFCRVLQDCGQVADGAEGQTAELHLSDMMVIKYRTIAPLVQSGQVCCL